MIVVRRREIVTSKSLLRGGLHMHEVADAGRDLNQRQRLVEPNPNAIYARERFVVAVNARGCLRCHH